MAEIWQWYFTLMLKLLPQERIASAIIQIGVKHAHGALLHISDIHCADARLNLAKMGRLTQPAPDQRGNIVRCQLLESHGRLFHR